MAAKDIKTRTKLLFEVEITLNESELKALDALAGYGIKSFLEVFYKHIGKHYLEPHESGLKSLFERVKELRHEITHIDEIKKKLRN